MKARPLFSAVLILGLGAGGCTTELVSKPVDPNAGPVDGQIYYLPERMFSMDVRYEFIDCREETDRVELDIDVTAEVSDRIVQGRAFYIPYEELSAGTKITKTTFDLHPNSTFAGMTVALTDTSGVVAANLVKTALTVAAATQGFPVVLGPPASARPGLKFTALQMQKWCNTAATDLRTKVDVKKKELADIEKNDKDVIAAKAAVDEAQKQWETDKAAREAAEKKKDEDAIKKAKAAEEKSEKSLTEKKTALQQILTKKTADLKREIARESKKLIRHVRRTWEPEKPAASPAADQAQQWINETLDISEDKGREWLGEWLNETGICQLLDPRTPDKAHTAGCLPDPNDDEKFAALFFRVESYLRLFGGHDIVSENVGDSENGIVYRQPLTGELTVCWRKCVVESGSLSFDTDPVLLQQVYSMPQFGYLGRLTLENGVLANNGVTAEVKEDGAVTKISFQSESQAEQASALLLGAASDFAAFKAAKKTDKETQESEEKNKVTAQKELYEELLGRDQAKDEYDAYLNAKKDAAE